MDAQKEKTKDYSRLNNGMVGYKAFRHVETLFVQGNIFVLNQNKPPCLVIKKEVNLFCYYQTKRVVLIQYEDITLDE